MWRALFGAILMSAACAVAAAEAILTESEPAGAGLYEFLMQRADAWERAGQPARQITDLKRAAESTSNGLQRLRARRELVIAGLSGGNLLEALEYNELAREAAMQSGRPPTLLWVLQQFANIYGRLGDVPKAEAAVAQTDQMMGRLRRSRGWERNGDQWTALHERARSRLFEAKGLYVEGEQAAATALAAAERRLKRR